MQNFQKNPTNSGIKTGNQDSQRFSYSEVKSSFNELNSYGNK
jgi:hypothetical protein